MVTKLMQSVPRNSMEPWLKDEVEFYPHQAEGVKKLYPKESFILADDMGLGKSLQALCMFCIDVIKSRSRTALIVCPVSLKGNWADEIEKFTRIPYVILGQIDDPKRPGRFKILSRQQREIQLLEFFGIEGPKILIVNYEQLAAHGDVLDRMEFDVGIFDEAHYLKTPTSQRTKASMKVRTRRSFMLTGTPMLNQVNELWTLLNRVDPKRYKSYYSFVSRYCVYGGYNDKQIVGVKNEKELREKVQSVMLRRLKEDVLNLKEPYFIQRKVDLLPEQQKLYDEVNEEYRLTTGDGEDPQDIENALTKFLRLKQICGTTLPFTGEDNSAKLDLAMNDATEVLKLGEKIVVFTQFRDVQAAFVERLNKHYKKSEVPIYQLHGDVPNADRQSVIKRWASEQGAAVIVCMLQVAGIGLNMTASRYAFFLDKLFVPGLNKQAVDRLHRIGQDETQAVQVFEYLTRGTVETRVEAILNGKTKLTRDIIEASTPADFKARLTAALLAKDDDGIAA